MQEIVQTIRDRPSLLQRAERAVSQIEDIRRPKEHVRLYSWNITPNTLNGLARGPPELAISPPTDHVRGLTQSMNSSELDVIRQNGLEIRSIGLKQKIGTDAFVIIVGYEEVARARDLLREAKTSEEREELKSLFNL